MIETCYLISNKLYNGFWFKRGPALQFTQTIKAISSITYARYNEASGAFEKHFYLDNDINKTIEAEIIGHGVYHEYPNYVLADLIYSTGKPNIIFNNKTIPDDRMNGISYKIAACSPLLFRKAARSDIQGFIFEFIDKSNRNILAWELRGHIGNDYYLHEIVLCVDNKILLQDHFKINHDVPGELVYTFIAGCIVIILFVVGISIKTVRTISKKSAEKLGGKESAI
jgi:hypothetical protein